MNNKIKEAFAQIQAEEELKNATKAYLIQKTHGYKKTVWQKPRMYVAVCTCLLCLLLGGQWFYFTPTSEISIDINPSLELSVNRFDRVISINGVNADGQEFADTLDIKFKKCADAIARILESNDISILLSNDEILTITVIGSDEKHSAKILSEIEGCTAHKRNVYCYFSSSNEVEAAHEAGLSYGKYRAFLELQKLDPDITPDAVQGMTMREIRGLMAELSNGNTNEIPLDEENGCGSHSFGNGHGNRKGNGNGQECR